MASNINIKINGLNGLEKKINTIVNNLPNAVEKGLKTASENTRDYAIHILGQDNGGIICELVNQDTKEIKSRIYTNQNKMPWSWFREFGTGRYAELEHIGKSKHFIESGYEEWYIPVNKVENPLNYPITTIQGKQFYVAHGAKAKPFMTPAGFERRQSNIEDVKNSIEEMLQEVMK